ncbi:hypothetical protein NCAS_0B02060 [Naumovozyma castellii]|uniref:Uncharacterized protein n=1 Tax=Naumovozyma castellii TaxID=27288 RepID=G0VBG4_NAUCA|nr:hypothetical protein NCAS_0B02060 [Naumovozyma castellii CBS 4309]CCC68290.1 hypothetical protein NCAS_0B02060 [Naumovozyma castellii CBS 4309]
MKAPINVNSDVENSIKRHEITVADNNDLLNNELRGITAMTSPNDISDEDGSLFSSTFPSPMESIPETEYLTNSKETYNDLTAQNQEDMRETRRLIKEHIAECLRDDSDDEVLPPPSKEEMKQFINTCLNDSPRRHEPDSSGNSKSAAEDSALATKEIFSFSEPPLTCGNETRPSEDYQSSSQFGEEQIESTATIYDISPLNDEMDQGYAKKSNNNNDDADFSNINKQIIPSDIGTNDNEVHPALSRNEEEQPLKQSSINVSASLPLPEIESPQTDEFPLVEQNTRFEHVLFSNNDIILEDKETLLTAAHEKKLSLGIVGKTSTFSLLLPSPLLETLIDAETNFTQDTIGESSNAVSSCSTIVHIDNNAPSYGKLHTELESSGLNTIIVNKMPELRTSNESDKTFPKNIEMPNETSGKNVISGANTPTVPSRETYFMEDRVASTNSEGTEKIHFDEQNHDKHITVSSSIPLERDYKSEEESIPFLRKYNHRIKKSHEPIILSAKKEMNRIRHNDITRTVITKNTLEMTPLYFDDGLSLWTDKNLITAHYNMHSSINQEIYTSASPSLAMTNLAKTYKDRSNLFTEKELIGGSFSPL